MANTVLVELTRTRTNPNTTPTSTSTSTSTPAFFPFQSLDVYHCARELAVRIHDARISDPELRDQATRAAKSAFLNLAEGLPDDRAAMRRKYFLASDGSLHEVVAAVDLAGGIGAIRDRPRRGDPGARGAPPRDAARTAPRYAQALMPHRRARPFGRARREAAATARTR